MILFYLINFEDFLSTLVNVCSSYTFNSVTVPLKASLHSQIDRCMLDSVSLWCISRREGDFWDVSCINSPQKYIAGLNWPLQCQLESLFY